MATPLQLPWTRFFDEDGDPAIGWKLYSYIAGTVTPLGTFTTPAGDVSNENPVVMDSDGYADVWMGDRIYKFILTDQNDVVKKTMDNVDGSVGGSNATEAWATHAVTDGQGAASLDGETVDFATYISADWDYVVKRGTTVIVSGTLSIQNLNGTGVVNDGLGRSSQPHGVTWSVSQTGQVCTLQAALDAGAGDGTIQLTRRRVPI